MTSDYKKVFKNPPQIETEHLILRAMRVSDAADMYEYASNPQTTEYLLWSPHPAQQSTAEYLRYIESLYKQGGFYDWAVILKSENKMIGTGGYAHVEEKHGCAEIGYVLNPAYWHKGYGTEVASELISFGFSVLGFNRIQARYMVGNEYSRSVMEKCGMTFEGIQRQLLYVKGKFRDIGFCAILREDYFKTHEKKEYRLHWYDRLR